LALYTYFRLQEHREWHWLRIFSIPSNKSFSEMRTGLLWLASLQNLDYQFWQEIECAYSLQYVVLNGRLAEEQPNHDPWSIRQTAVYQRYDSELNRIVFILVSPSQIVKDAIAEALEAGCQRKRLPKPFDLHLIIVSALQDNWRLYVRSLEELIREQVNFPTMHVRHFYG